LFSKGIIGISFYSDIRKNCIPIQWQNKSTLWWAYIPIDKKLRIFEYKLPDIPVFDANNPFLKRLFSKVLSSKKIL